MCLILQGTRVQVQVLKSCKSVKKSSEEVLFIKTWQIAWQLHLSRFNIWISTNSSTVVSIENYEIQIFRSVFHAYPSYLCRVSFLTTLDIYKDYFKGRQTWCKGFYWYILWLETIFPSSSFSWRSCRICTSRVL